MWTLLPESGLPFVSVLEKSSVRILPDGAMDVIATFHPDGHIDKTFAVGAMTCPQLTTVGNQAVAGIRFLPGAGGSALGVNAVTLTDGQIDVRDVARQHGAVRDVFRLLHRNASDARALHRFADVIGMNRRFVPPLVRRAAGLIASSSTSTRIEQIAKDLGVSRQHLAREFAAHAGLTPKRYAQICRVRAMLARVQRRVANCRRESSHAAAAQVSWSALAADYGYADQSHLISEVSAIIGQTPGEWQATAGSNIPIVPVSVAPL
ncbi:MAG: helix-turn-helix transcriptional regulator [Phycisphaerae bacterium]|nr:helix-turn-helix transcriptional regulator [Gemmatimonadaceae bacterium]